MKILNNMKVGSKIILLVATLLLCLAVVAGVGILGLKQLDHESNAMYSVDMLALRAAKEANIQLINISRAVRNMALAQDAEQRNRYKQAYGGFIVTAREQLELAKDRIVSEDGRKIFDNTVKSFDELLVQQQEIIDNMDQRTLPQTVARIQAIRVLADSTDDLMTDLGTAMTKEAADRNKAMTEIAEQGFILSLGVFVAALLLGLVLGAMIKKAIANPLVSIAGKAGLVAEGDLSQDFALVRRDELGDLASALEQMVLNLRNRISEAEQKSREAAEQSEKAREAMEEAHIAKEKAEQGQRAILVAAENVEQVVSRLSAATEELSAQIEESSRGTDIQRERVSGSAAAMEEMNSTVMEVARNAGAASENSERARTNAQDGADIVKKSVEAIGMVQEDTEELKQNMERLGDQAESIGTILTVISDIADQTNLLALNAAIEAARAGEAGRGFAVVADEVRKLAEKTMTATKEVGDAISGIQTGTRQSIDTVERTSNNLDNTTELVKKSGEALTTIVAEVIGTADQVRAIATAAEEQSAASEEITHSLEEINTMAGETATAMQQSAQAVSDLSVQAQELQRLVNELRNG
ncbi:methyl-accepting chemotaxis protein [Desulfovibrio sp. OttesenSCG-928-O18]|nr:methyl-accepting chemotaxis protein [Desulfovibrio sp. OttesenSCG-928-O18]